MGLLVYVRIENCTFDLEFCSLIGWLEFGGKEKKEQTLLPTQWRSGSNVAHSVICLLK